MVHGYYHTTNAWLKTSLKPSAIPNNAQANGVKGKRVIARHGKDETKIIFLLTFYKTVSASTKYSLND